VRGLDDAAAPGNGQSILSAAEAQTVSGEIRRLLDNVRSLIYIDPRTLEYLIAAKIAGGHAILADSHGVGKTSLARALAQSIQWSGPNDRQAGGAGEFAQADLSAEHVPIESFSRIQCTVDLLPQDILGFSRYELSTSSLIFNRGPIFAHFVLCDEINLLTPKTQGSFFQAMEEQAISIEGNTYHLPDPFFIIATMNLKGAHLFPLPVPQLDRFMVQLSLGYPSDDDEERIVHQHGRDDSWSGFAPVVAQERLNQWQGMVDSITIHDEVVSYLVTLVRQTRGHPAIETGASPRTGVKVSRLARALALVRGDNWVSVDLIKEIFVPAVAHRMIMQDPATPAAGVLQEILDTVPVDGRRPAQREVPESGRAAPVAATS
jgi:MoxR-like ATPase